MKSLLCARAEEEPRTLLLRIALQKEAQERKVTVSRTTFEQ